MMKRPKKSIVRKKAKKKAIVMWRMSASQRRTTLQEGYPVTTPHMLPFVSTLSKSNARAGRVLKSMFKMGLAEAARNVKGG